MREQERDFGGQGAYFLLYTHELYPGGNEHFNQTSRRVKDLYLDLCMMVKNSFCHLLVISSRRKARPKSYCPDKLGFQALDYRFMNGEDINEVEQELADFLK